MLALFFVATSALAIYGLHLYVLLWLFRLRASGERVEQRRLIEEFGRRSSEGDWPVVTTQIPLYNELAVAERIIRAVAAMDYPSDRHEIQVLDDSDDETSAFVDSVVSELRSKGFDIETIRRGDRVGYKAGALAEGVKKARGEFIAVFDSDFVPPQDFLRRAIPLMLHDPGMSCLQGRWTHLNENHSWLTRAQSLGIDGHFAIEQGARAWNGLLMNFNGTAGVWRRAAINDPKVGGWDGDTLTEDLDLSYRAQLAGWRIGYCFDLACPAELPESIDAFKSQQRRWATGSMQVGVKLLGRIWRSSLTLGQRIEATLHLTHYSVSFWMLILAVVARPMLLLHMRDGLEFGSWVWATWCIVLFAAIAPAVMYGYARWTVGGGFSGIRMIPQLVALGCGMCVNNSLAVLRGLRTAGGEFVRTPKSGSSRSNLQRGVYGAVRTPLWAVELFLGTYTLASFGYYVVGREWPVSVFLLLYGVGFLAVGWMSCPACRWLGTFRSNDRSIAAPIGSSLGESSFSDAARS